jgi:predicted amidohydrolase
VSSIRIAVVAWELRTVRGDGDFYGHFHDLVTIAHEEGAEAVIFPENQTLELLNLAPDLEARDVPKFLIQFSGELEAWIDRISRSSGMVIVGGSHFKETPDGIKSVCAVGNGVDGLSIVEKLNLTPYERNFWRLAAGMDNGALPDPRIGVTVGNDALIPEYGRLIANRGGLIHAMPAFSADIRGYQRARWSARARATENLMFVAQASIIGSLGREPASNSYGVSAIFTPSFEPFPESAVLGETELGEEQVIVRTLDFDLLGEIKTLHGLELRKRENELS